jgi:DNA-binding PadR family transcriptional regulator
MYELIILALLMRQNAHGYLIAKIINDMIGPYAKVSNGRLYPLLAKLEEEGLITSNVETVDTHRGERQLRAYQITEEGCKRFHQLMMDTTSNPGEYQKLFWHKAIVLEFLKPAERLYLIDHYINYCQAHILHLTAEKEDMVSGNYMSPSQLEATVNLMRHITDQWLLELDWARNLREQEVARAEGRETKVTR